MKRARFWNVCLRVGKVQHRMLKPRSWDVNAGCDIGLFCSVMQVTKLSFNVAYNRFSSLDCYEI